MGVLSRIGAMIRRSPAPQPDGLKRVVTDRLWLHGTVTNTDLARSRYTQNRQLQELVLRCVGYVYICAALNATYCESIPVRLYKRADGTYDGKRRKVGRVRKAWLRSRMVGAKAAHWADRSDEIEEVTDHPVLALMRDPNGDDTGSEYRRLLYMQLWLLGNGFENFIDGDIPSLRLMQPQNVNIKPDESGERLIEAYYYGRESSRLVRFAPDEVLQHKHMPSPIDPYTGIGPLHGVSTEADILSAATVWELNRLNNGQRPDFAVKVAPGTDPKTVETLKSWWRNAFRGPNKSGEPFVSDETVEVMPIPFANDRDLQYQESMNRMEKTIRDAYGVGDMLGVKADGLQLGGTGRDAQERRFMRQTIMPSVVARCETWTERLLPLMGEEAGEYWFAPDNPDTEDATQQATMHKAYTDGGILCIDEVRQELGYDPLPGDEGAIARYNGVPLDRVGLLGGGLLGPDGRPGNKPDKGDEPAENPRAESGEGNPDAADGQRGEGKRHKHDGECKANGCTHGESLSAWVCGAGGYERKDIDIPSEQETALRAAVQRWVDRLAPTADGTALVFNAANAAELFRQEAAEAISTIFAAGYDFQARALGDASPEALGVFSVPSTRVSEYAASHIYRLSQEVSQTVADNLRAAIMRHVEGGLPLSTTAQAVKQAMGDITTYAAERIAHTESADAYTAGGNSAAAESGVVAGKRWLLSSDACAFCKEAARVFNDGPPVPVDQPFAVKGSVLYAGGRAMKLDYKDIQGPTLHPGCRCSLTYVLKE